MAPFPVFLLLFLLVPLVEIYFMIKVGSWIGAFTTVVLVVLTAVLGAALARHQGLATLQRLQQTIARGEAPALEMLEGGLLLVGALLLLVPGFITDLAGFTVCSRLRGAGWPCGRLNVIEWHPLALPHPAHPLSTNHARLKVNSGVRMRTTKPREPLIY